MFEDFKKGWELYLETLPFVTSRMIIYGILSLAGFFYAMTCLGMVTVIQDPWFSRGIIAVALAGLLGGIKVLRLGPLYRLKVAHAAVISELFRQGSVPQGKAQIVFGKSRALHKYRTQKNIELLEPHPQHLLRFFKRTDASLQGGYDSTPLLHLSSLLTLLSLVSWGAFMLILSPPLLGVISIIPSFTSYLVISMVYGAWILKLIFVDPFVLTTIMSAHLKQNQVHRAPQRMAAY